MHADMCVGKSDALPETAEHALWRAVVAQAVEDACLDETAPAFRLLPKHRQQERIVWRDQARAWLTRRTADLEAVCDAARLESTALVKKARALAARGWR